METVEIPALITRNSGGLILENLCCSSLVVILQFTIAIKCLTRF